MRNTYLRPLKKKEGCLESRDGLSQLYFEITFYVFVGPCLLFFDVYGKKNSIVIIVFLFDGC